MNNIMKKSPLITIALVLMYSCGKMSSSKKISNTNSSNKKTIMAIFAHSDDETMVSPVLAKYVKEGVKVFLVVATDGSKGVMSHANIPAGDSLAKIRSVEASCVAKTLGIDPVIFLNYKDGSLTSLTTIDSLGKEVDSLLNEYQPNVVITWGPEGGYGHPDHRIVSSVVTENFQKEREKPLGQLLYAGLPAEAINRSQALNTEQANWFKDKLHTTQKKLLNYRIQCTKEDFAIGRKALGCCKSQFTTEAMDELFVLLNQMGGVFYLRSWIGSDGIKNDVFE